MKIEKQELFGSEAHYFEDFAEPYHLRCGFSRERNTLKIIVIGDDDKLYGVTITEVTPMLGHNKTDTCCS